MNKYLGLGRVWHMWENIGGKRWDNIVRALYGNLQWGVDAGC